MVCFASSFFALLPQLVRPDQWPCYWVSLWFVIFLDFSVMGVLKGVTLIATRGCRERGEGKKQRRRKQSWCKRKESRGAILLMPLPCGFWAFPWVASPKGVILMRSWFGGSEDPESELAIVGSWRRAGRRKLPVLIIYSSQTTGCCFKIYPWS